MYGIIYSYADYTLVMLTAYENTGIICVYLADMSYT